MLPGLYRSCTESGYHFANKPKVGEGLKKIRAYQHAGEMPVRFERFRVKGN